MNEGFVGRANAMLLEIMVMAGGCFIVDMASRSKKGSPNCHMAHSAAHKTGGELPTHSVHTK